MTKLRPEKKRQKVKHERRGEQAMMRLRRASVIATPSLLAWAATASAECAWGGVVESGAQDWVIHGTHQSRAECLKQLEREFSDHPLTASDRANGNVRLNVAGTIVYHCLPDTVDPRGAKRT